MDKGSAQGRELYITTYNTHKRQTATGPVGFKPAIPASERPQAYASDYAATGIGTDRVKIEIKVFF